MRVTKHKLAPLKTLETAAMSALILRQGPLMMMSALVALLPTAVALDARAFAHGDSVTLLRDHHHAIRGGGPSHNDTNPFYFQHWCGLEGALPSLDDASCAKQFPPTPPSKRLALSRRVLRR
jgi:hypothetical protein